MNQERQGSRTPEVLRKLFAGQSSGVLGTYGQGKPYVSIMAFAVTDDLRTIVMVSPGNTRKYSNLLETGLGAFLADNRTETGGDRDRGLAVTAEGSVFFPQGDQGHALTRLFEQKNPDMRPFIRDETTVLFALKVEQYVLVRQLSDTEVYCP